MKCKNGKRKRLDVNQTCCSLSSINNLLVHTIQLAKWKDKETRKIDWNARMVNEIARMLIKHAAPCQIWTTCSYTQSNSQKWKNKRNAQDRRKCRNGKRNRSDVNQTCCALTNMNNLLVHTIQLAKWKDKETRKIDWNARTVNEIAQAQSRWCWCWHLFRVQLPQHQLPSESHN